MHWTFVLEGGPRRVNHAAVVVDNTIYSFGGYCAGQDSEVWKPMDVHMFNVDCYNWTSLAVPSACDVQYDNVPYQRYGHTAVTYKNACYIWGGRNDIDGACDVLFQFDPRSGLWSRMATIGDRAPARDGHGACVYHDQMIIFGGFEEGYQRFSNETYALDFRNYQWNQLHPTGAAPQWRDFHTVTVIRDRMYVFGGRCDESGPFHTNMELYINDLVYLDLLNNSWNTVQPRGVIPNGRRSHSAWAMDGKLYIFGGYNGIMNEHYNDLYCFDPDLSTWTKLKALGNGPKPRRRQCCVTIGDRVYLFGGTSPVSSDLISSFAIEDTLWTERNLTDHSDLYILDYAPTLKTLCMLQVWNTPKLYSEIGWLPSTLRYDLEMLNKQSKTNLIRKDG